MILRITNHNPNPVSVYLIFRGKSNLEPFGPNDLARSGGKVVNIYTENPLKKHKNLSKICI